MTVRDRILAATGGDHEQADLVEQMVARAKEARPQNFADQAPLPELACPNCKVDYDEDGHCSGCGRQRRVR